MNYCELSDDEKFRRRRIAKNTRRMIINQLGAVEGDGTSLVSGYRDYYLQIFFSQLHPLMVICLAKTIKYPCKEKHREIVNELNIKSILGSHAINEEVGCYSYRSTYWLDNEIDSSRFWEIIERCVDEAQRGFYKLSSVK